MNAFANLPEPDHFTLQQVCRHWKCDEEHLLQYCNSKMLEIGVMINGIECHFFDIYSNKIQYGLSGFYVLSIADVNEIHHWGENVTFEDSCKVADVYLSKNSDTFFLNFKNIILLLFRGTYCFSSFNFNLFLLLPMFCINTF